MRRRTALALLIASASSCGGGGDGITVTTHVATVVVSPGSATIAPSGTTQLTAATLDAQGNTVTGQQVAWSSNNSAVASVSAGGLVTGVAAGTATISATSDGKTGTATITVAVPNFSLTVTGAGSGSGTVTAPAAGGQSELSCTITAGTASGTCSASYRSGTPVTLTAAPKIGHTFGGWAGACSGTSTCQVTMSQARSVTATFSLGVDPSCTPVALTFPGVANGTLSSTSCILSNLYPSISYRFTTDGLTATNFAVASTFATPTLEVMLDPPNGSNLASIGSAGAATAAYLLPAGNYRTRVASRSGNGTFTLTGSTAPLSLSTGCDDRTLLVSITLTSQTLAATDCAYGDGTYFDMYTVFSQKPCRIAMQSTALDSYLEVWDLTPGANTRITSNNTDPAGGTNNALIDLAACNNGGHVLYIYANSFTTTPAVGAYTLTFTITGGGSIVASERPSAPILFPNAWLNAASGATSKLVKKER